MIRGASFCTQWIRVTNRDLGLDQTEARVMESEPQALSSSRVSYSQVKYVIKAGRTWVVVRVEKLEGEICPL